MHCEFCRTALSLVACPRCFGRLFAGARHCQHCGAKVEVPARPGPAEGPEPGPRKCPRCTAVAAPALTAHLVGETLLDECRHCGGVWIDSAAFEHVVLERDRQAALHQLLAVPALTDSSRPGWQQPVTYLHCPDCNELMMRQNFGKCSGVIVDVCRPHGIWFDRDELGAVLDFVMQGGLDKTRRLQAEELQRQIEHKQSELGQLAALVDDSGSSRNAAELERRHAERLQRFGEVLCAVFDRMWR
jgi:Zn-finger nucleic acid-binding protein